MAYMAFESWGGAAADVAEAVRFSPVELRAIGLGEQVDVARERRRGGWLGRTLGVLFGIEPARPLADPHLEALRRFASKARYHRDLMGREDVEALVAAGYTAGQAWGLTGYLGGRPRSGARG
ncbi:hypothetical protein [Sphingomonas jatrophae]|uniref:Uncharacterized protein n=1 Tax=Sphingomonas jatrophae TaxID=1166337 RepID=A0A1I6JSC4_9SPHN|nr:hypothetical protein [Sphingomonas jatrophae]SFR81821.1 hypothetical protein SAMN05192580_0768 [Sphingomonas jatrophae]